MARNEDLGAIVSIGDELVIGQSLDTNSRWLSERLTDHGITISEHVTVPDELGAIVSTLRRLVDRSGVVIATGGLGPTADDLTREAISVLVHEPLIEDQESLSLIRGWFSRSNRAMPEQNRVQALRPSSGIHIQNDNGTAPGMHVVVGGANLFCLPGPPSEMKPMFEEYVGARLTRSRERVVRTAIFQTMGLGESEIAQRLGSLMARDRVPLVGTTASGGIVSVRVRYEGIEPRERVDALMGETEREIRAAVGEAVFADGPEPLAAIVIGRLRQNGQRLSVVESCTGGMLGETLTAIPGASDVFLGGWLTYSNEMKERLVGVPSELLQRHGAVSREVAEAMACGGLTRSGADHCLSVTGIAGPGGGSPGKPTGTVWIGLASRSVTSDCRRFLMRGERHVVRQWSVTSALAMLDLRLRNRSSLGLLRQQDP